MIRKIGILLGLLVSSFSSLSQTPSIQTNYAFPKEQGISFEIFLRDRVGVPENLLYNMGYLEKLKKWNPDIQNFSSLDKYEKVYIELPYGTVLSPKQRQEPRPVEKVVEEVQREEPESREKYSFSAFYTYTNGDFEETDLEETNQISAGQSSPLNLEVEGKYFLESRNVISGGLQLIKLSRSTQTDSNNEISIPLEYRLRGDYQYNGFKGFLFSPFIGASYELITSYNTPELRSGSDLRVEKNHILFLSLGLSKEFRFLEKSFEARASFSPSLASSYSGDGEGLSGYEVGGELQMLQDSKWSYHLNINAYSLSGSSNLFFTRYGVGVGYKFF